MTGEEYEELFRAHGDTHGPTLCMDTSCTPTYPNHQVFDGTPAHVAAQPQVAVGDALLVSPDLRKYNVSHYAGSQPVQ